MSAMRAACYARFSTDMQRETSLTDQLATARRYAEAQGWTVLEDQLYTDAALSGVSLERPGIQALLAAAARRPLPFDVLLVDDSSRVARDIADAVRMLQQLKFFGLRVVYISQGIDSASEQAELLIAMHGMVDGLYLREMAAKIRRGLRGQIERGYATGSITYGYHTVPVPDPSGKTDVNGYPVLLGKRVVVEPAEARVIVQIFEWSADGLGVVSMVERLNRSGVAGPRGGRWRQGAVKRILVNERYTGKLIWGQRRFERRPGTRQKLVRHLPRSEWQVLEQPELRIVDATLWDRVQARRAEMRRLLPATGPTLLRGRHAAMHSKNLFSGFMRCGVCGGSVTAVHNGSGSPRYGCSRSHLNGLSACENRLTIRAKVADPLLLEGLRAELLQPATIRAVTDRLAAALNQRIDDRPRREADTRAARELAAQRLQRLITAIESGVSGASLSAAILEREADLRRCDAELEQFSEPLHQRLAVMPAWVEHHLRDLAALLTDSPERTKSEFRRLELTVTLWPIREEGPRPFYRAVGHAALPCLSETRDLGGPLVDRSDPQSAGTRTSNHWGFQVDLPANHLGPWSRRTRVG